MKKTRAIQTSEGIRLVDPMVLQLSDSVARHVAGGGYDLWALVSSVRGAGRVDFRGQGKSTGISPRKPEVSAWRT
jgi:hypothetical protein